MKILITGAKGFLGKNLIAELQNRGYDDIVEYDRNTPWHLLDVFTKECDYIFHLAGVTRPTDVEDFDLDNRDFTSKILEKLKSHNNACPIVFSSSIQAELDNPYGKSKKASEEELMQYGQETGAKIMIFRLTNLFGKWSRPNYNSVVATFCYNIARDLEITISNPDTELTLCHVDNVINEFINALEGKTSNQDVNYCIVPGMYKIKLGELANKFHAFRANRKTLIMPSLESELDKALYGTYLSYLPEDDFSYQLDMKQDARGWLAEFIKSNSGGQVFISKTKKGIIRGNHWHHTKVEKFLVIQGQAAIKFRKIGSNDEIKYTVSGEKLEVVDIPPGYIHTIENTGTDDLITLFWAGEVFNRERPDTYYLGVEK